MPGDKTFSKAELDAAIKDAIEAAIEPIKAKNEELLKEAKDAKAKLRAASEIKPEDLTAAEERADKAESALAEANKQNKVLTGERDKAIKALEAETSFTSKLLVQDGLKSALLANGVKDEDFIDTLAAKFAIGATVITEGDARVAKVGDKPIPDAIKEWAASDAGKKFVAAPNNSGGGAPGGSGGGASGKTMTRQAFDALDPAAKMAFSKEGGKLTDAVA